MRAAVVDGDWLPGGLFKGSERLLCLLRAEHAKVVCSARKGGREERGMRMPAGGVARVDNGNWGGYQYTCLTDSQNASFVVYPVLQWLVTVRFQSDVLH